LQTARELHRDSAAGTAGASGAARAATAANLPSPSVRQ
jgi:hypothetical protein